MDTALFFDSYYNNAEINALLVMQCDGTIMNVNQAFTRNFGYSNDDITGKNFSLLFNQTDRQEGKPQLELQTVAARGQSLDENYVMDKNGTAIWVVGEALLVSDGEGRNYIVKDIVNLQSKKQLQLFLTEAEELLERIFDSSRDIAMLILDGSMKMVSANQAFLDLFGLKNTPEPGCRLSDIPHPFWNSAEIKQAVTHMLVTNHFIKKKEFELEVLTGERKTIRIDSKIIDKQSGTGKRVFIIVERLD
jgi:PAS domain S-box-containing protein